MGGSTDPDWGARTSGSGSNHGISWGPAQPGNWALVNGMFGGGNGRYGGRFGEGAMQLMDAPVGGNCGQGLNPAGLGTPQGVKDFTDACCKCKDMNYLSGLNWYTYPCSGINCSEMAKQVANTRQDWDSSSWVMAKMILGYGAGMIGFLLGVLLPGIGWGIAIGIAMALAAWFTAYLVMQSGFTKNERMCLTCIRRGLGGSAGIWNELAVEGVVGGVVGGVLGHYGKAVDKYLWWIFGFGPGVSGGTGGGLPTNPYQLMNASMVM
jgi:hypothetical protein